MKYLPISNTLFIENRAKFVKHLKPNAMAVFNSNDLMPTNEDGTFRFRQNNDIFYLSGIDQEESILVIFPDSKDEKLKEALFLRETNDTIAIWEGHKYTKEEARAVSGVENIYWLSEFDAVFPKLMAHCEYVYLSTNEHYRSEVLVETRNARFIRYCKERFPLHDYKRLSPIMDDLRILKSNIEIELLQTACDITEKGFRRILEFVKPKITEYQIEAEYIHEFLSNRATGFAYSPIVASGYNACVLHYIDNNQVCKDGDVLLMDVGAEYANYSADMTRSIPVNGRYTDRQKAVYNAVLKVFKQAKALLKAGNNWQDYHRAVGELMTEALLDLKLLSKKEVKNQDKDKPAYKKYFMHGTSHHLGLNTHDAGDIYRTFEEGMVFTCEPGIYIPKENLGIRIENDIVLTKEGNFDLMQNIPIEVEEIESLMNK